MPLIDVSFPSPGLIDGRRIHDFVADYVSDKQLDEASIPFRCVATNFLLKQEVVITAGLMVDAVRASISIPGIFAPFKREENVYLVDGGVVNPVPVSVVRDMGADVVIAVNLNKDPKAERSNESSASKGSDTSSDSTAESKSSDQDTSDTLSSLANRYDALKDVLQDQVDQWIPDPQTGLNIFDVLGNSINVMEQRVTEANLQIDRPDLLIEPNLMEFGIFDFHQSKPMIQIGYDTAKAVMPRIQESLTSSD
ncbi:MAG: patatin family protein, partial [Leptolyngbya sp. SIO4C1]|nr:patatin family protein [Leptolyngbya sp. SIO4C1]